MGFLKRWLLPIIFDLVIVAVGEMARNTSTDVDDKTFQLLITNRDELIRIAREKI